MRTISGRSYGWQYTIGPFGSLDGWRYRTLIYVQGAGDAATPAELDAAEQAVMYRFGRPGGISTLWEPIIPTRLDIRFITSSPSDLSELISGNSIDASDPTVKDDISLIAVFQREINPILEIWEDVWAGYLLPDTVQDWAYEPGAVQISAFDGFGIWRSLAYTLTGYQTILDTVLDNLNEISALESPQLFMIQRWFPYRATAITGDPEKSIYTPESAWTESDIFTLRYEVMRQVVARFGMELFQADGNWWCVQPHELVPLGRDGAFYDMAGVKQASFGYDAVSQDSDDYEFVVGTARYLSGGASAVAVPYDFKPDLDSLLYNSSFEEADTDGGFVDPSNTYYAPKYWTVTQGGNDARVMRAPISFVYAEATADNSFVLWMDAETVTFDAGEAVQENLFFIPARGEHELTCTWSYWEEVAAGVWGVDPLIHLSVGGFYIAADSSALQTTTAILKGKEVTIYTDPILESVTGAVVGTPIIPAGAEVRFTGGSPATLTLSEDIKVGDTQIRGELDENLDGDERVNIYFWTSDSAESGFLAWEKLQVHVFMRTPAGSDVSGYFGIRITQPTGQVGDWAAYDGIQTTLRIDGQTVRSLTWQSAVARRGEALQTETFLIGDGPALLSQSQLYIADGSGGHEPSQQGGNVGWKTGAYGAEATTGRTIDRHQSRELLRTVCRGIEERTITLILRDQSEFGPHNVLAHPHEVTGTDIYLWRQHLDWDVAAGMVSGRFRRLYYDTSLTVEETLTNLNESRPEYFIES